MNEHEEGYSMPFAVAPQFLALPNVALRPHLYRDQKGNSDDAVVKVMGQK